MPPLKESHLGLLYHMTDTLFAFVKHFISGRFSSVCNMNSN